MTSCHTKANAAANGPSFFLLRPAGVIQRPVSNESETAPSAGPLSNSNSWVPVLLFNSIWIPALAPSSRRSRWGQSCTGMLQASALKRVGSANGNRTCQKPVQSSSVRSKYFILRSVGTRRCARTAPRNPDVAARWLRTLPKRVKVPRGSTPTLTGQGWFP
jgi:hypothetical protein